MSYQFDLPMPPSANVYWRVSNGIVHVSKVARDYKITAGWLAKAAGVHTPLAGDVAVTVTVYRPERRGDLDNRLKVLLDSLKGIAFEDDDQVVEIHAYRRDTPKDGRISVEVALA